MSMVGKLVDRNGKLYVLYETAHDSEPKITFLWWLVERTTGNPYHCDRPEPGDVATYRSDGTWSTHRPDTCRSTGSVYVGGSAQAAHKETVSAPSPKVRAGIEVRWYQGRYEKLLKKGWVTV